MAKLILLRHLQSQWNKENIFSGWTDVPLSAEGIASAPEKAQKLAGIKIEKVFTSPLSRNKNTAELILKNLGLENLPITFDKALDERSYGLLEGMNKGEIKKEFGEARTYEWRRAWDVAPPEGESLKDVYERAVPFYQNLIEPELKAGKNVLVVGSHNSLRALAKYIENIPDEEIINYEIPFGGMTVYDLDQNLKVLNKELK
ncbi:MAG: 2,3-diphosphoglycerate-dependent phosphoglycerate mutase [Candidatus Paceibacterota bacterium]|jgi:2,3-bisphosphoglycerate-dependent phosphoglycerate mutase